MRPATAVPRRHHALRAGTRCTASQGALTAPCLGLRLCTSNKLQVGGRRMASQLWSNLDGSATPVALRVLPHVAKELEPGSKGWAAGWGAPGRRTLLAGWLASSWLRTVCTAGRRPEVAPPQGLIFTAPPRPLLPCQRAAAGPVWNAAPDLPAGVCQGGQPGSGQRPAGLPPCPVRPGTLGGEGSRGKEGSHAAGVVLAGGAAVKPLAARPSPPPTLPCAPITQVLLRPQQFAALPVEQRRCVLLGLWYALNWCRELVNCFAGQLQPNGWVPGRGCRAAGVAGVQLGWTAHHAWREEGACCGRACMAARHAASLPKQPFSLPTLPLQAG